MSGDAVADGQPGDRLAGPGRYRQKSADVEAVRLTSQNGPQIWEWASARPTYGDDNFLTSSIALKGEDSCELVTAQHNARAATAWLSRYGRPSPRWHLLCGVSPAHRGSRITAVLNHARRLTRAATACPAAVLRHPLYRAVPGAPPRPERRGFRIGGFR